MQFGVTAAAWGWSLIKNGCEMQYRVPKRDFGTLSDFLICINDLPHLFPLPKERTCQRKISSWRKIVRPIQSRDIPKTRRTILPLLEERAGVRTVVQTIPVPTPKFTPPVCCPFPPGVTGNGRSPLPLVRGNGSESGAEATALQTLARLSESVVKEKALRPSAFPASPR